MTLLSRRTLLVASVGAPVAILASCSDEKAEREREQDDPVRIEALTDEVSLVAAYRSAVDSQPELAARLAPILDQHLAHIALLSEGAASTPAVPAGRPPSPDVLLDAGSPSSTTPEGTADSASQTATPSESASPEASTMNPVPALRERERAAADQRVRQCVGAGSASLARTLSLIGASEAQHVVELAP
jgi:hypothetical protein